MSGQSLCSVLTASLGQPHFTSPQWVPFHRGLTDGRQFLPVSFSPKLSVGPNLKVTCRPQTGTSQGLEGGVQNITCANASKPFYDRPYRSPLELRELQMPSESALR